MLHSFTSPIKPLALLIQQLRFFSFVFQFAIGCLGDKRVLVKIY